MGMTSERWELVTKIFGTALDQPQSARRAFIVRECTGDPELENEVLRLLAADEQAGSFLERPAASTLQQRRTLNITDSPPVIQAGTIVSARFEILRLVGQGGMGQVYEALDLELKVPVALKAIRPDVSSDPRMLSRFRREVQLTRRITHPNVCRTFDIERHSSTAGDGTSSDLIFLTMELLEGETLADLLRRRGRMTVAEAYPLVLQMIAALSAAHAVSIVHRDFKPSNVLLVPSNREWKASAASPSSNPPSLPELRVVVTDFGLARAVLPDGQISAEHAATSLTGNQALLGTLIYMAPEQFERGEATVASDIYSLGLVMYEMVTGSRPFADPFPFAEAAKRLKQPAPSPRILVPELDSSWEAAICRCVESEPGRRFQSAQDIVLILQKEQSMFSLRLASAESLPKRLSKTTKFKRARKIWVVVLFLVALSVGLLRLIEWRYRSAKVPAGSMVLMTDILNESHDTELDGTTELLRSQLAQSSYMNLMEPTQVAQALERMSAPKDTELTPRQAREVAWREGVPLVIFGTISRVAEDYRLDLKAERVGKDPSYPKSSWRFSETAASKKDFFEVVDHGGSWVRHLTGEAESAIENADRRPEDVTTSSWEALKVYSDGQRLASQDRLNEAALLFKQAAEKDPEFAMAWMRLGDTLDTIGKSSEGFADWHKALDVSGDRRLTQREELRIKGMYASDTGDLKAAIDYFSQYSIAYPNDYLGYFYRGVPLVLSAHANEAIEILHNAENLRPDSYYIVDHLARYNLIVGNFEATSRYTARVRQLGHPDYANEVEGQSNALNANYERALQLFRSLRDAEDPFLRSVHFYLEADVLAEQGLYGDAITVLNEGIAADLLTGDAADRADKLMALAYLCFKRGDRNSGREAALKSVEAEPGVRRTAELGSLLARSGFVHDAKRLEKNLKTGDHAVASEVARLRLHGEILLVTGGCRPALPELERASAHDQEKGLLRDYWGRALLACGRVDEALREYKRLNEQSPYVWHQPEFYEPGLRADLLFDYARAASRLDKGEARSALSQYLTLRRSADSNIEDVVEAKRWLKEWGSVTR